MFEGSMEEWHEHVSESKYASPEKNEDQEEEDA